MSVHENTTCASATQSRAASQSHSHQSESNSFEIQKTKKIFALFQFTSCNMSLFYRVCESEWRIWIGNPCFIASWLSYSLHFVEAENIW